MAYISKNPMLDRDVLKRKKMFGKAKLERISDLKELKARVFRNLFVEERDEVILGIIWNYFKVVQNKWPNAWNVNTQGNILNKSTGIIAFMKFLRHVIVYLDKFDESIEQDEFQKVFENITLQDSDFDKTVFIPGSSGQSALLKTLVTQSGINA